jgi:hypothetical protein
LWQPRGPGKDTGAPSGLFSVTRAGTQPRRMALVLSHDERRELEARLRSRKIRSEDARRARVILMIADEASYSTIRDLQRFTTLELGPRTQN